MPVFHCLRCGQAISVGSEFYNRSFSCPRCGEVIRVDLAQPTDSLQVVPPIVVQNHKVDSSRRSLRSPTILGLAIAVSLALVAIGITAISIYNDEPVGKKRISQVKLPTKATDDRSPTEPSARSHRPSSTEDSEPDGQERTSNPAQQLTRPPLVAEIDESSAAPEDDQEPATLVAPKLERSPSPEEARKRQLDNVNQGIASLNNSPSPATRMSAARALGRSGEFANMAAPALADAFNREVSVEVRMAIVSALGDLGSQASPTIPSLAKLVKQTKYDELRRLAFESIVSIDPKSPEVQAILTQLLVGRSGRTIEYPNFRNSRSPTVVNKNRLYAILKIAEIGETGVDVRWAIPLVIDICDVTVRAQTLRDDDEKLIAASISTLLRIGRHDPRTLNCFKTQRDVVLGNEANYWQREMRVRFDSLVKMIVAELGEHK